MATTDDLPPGLRDALIRLWRLPQPIHVQILLRDTWAALGVIQFATRNPALSAEQRQIIERFGRELQRGLVLIDPTLEPYLEMGWDPQHDR
jgi:hypothetical protein